MQAREMFGILRRTFGLSNNEIIVYYEIYSIYFYGGQNACYATNNYFEEELGISSGTIKRIIKTLQEKGLLEIRFQRKNGCLTERNLYPLHEKYLIQEAKEIKRTRKKVIEERAEEISHEDHFDPRTRIILISHEDHFDPQVLDNNNLRIESNSIVENLEKSHLDNIKMKWNNIATKYNLAKISSLTKTRISQFNQRVKDAGGEDMFFKIVDNAISSSTFLRGKNTKRWKVNFDFFLRQSSFVKSAEGAYNDHSKVAPIVQAVTGKKEEISNEDLFKEFNFNGGKNE